MYNHNNYSENRIRFQFAKRYTFVFFFSPCFSFWFFLSLIFVSFYFYFVVCCCIKLREREKGSHSIFFLRVFFLVGCFSFHLRCNGKCCSATCDQISMHTFKHWHTFYFFLWSLDLYSACILFCLAFSSLCFSLCHSIHT